LLVNLAAQRPTKSGENEQQSYKGCDQNIGKKILSTVPVMTDVNRKTFNDLENTETTIKLKNMKKTLDPHQRLSFRDLNSIISIIIHSKDFPVSDWLKEHA